VSRVSCHSASVNLGQTAESRAITLISWVTADALGDPAYTRIHLQATEILRHPVGQRVLTTQAVGGGAVEYSRARHASKQQGDMKVMVTKKFSSIALGGIAIVLATATLAQAAVMRAESHDGSGVAGHAPSGHFEGRGAIDGHRFEDHHFDRGFHGGPATVAPFYWPDYPYAPEPDYMDQAPTSSYWYYCPSYGAYYPTVQSCPEAWVPVQG
jgi:hypothetical protein